MTKDRMRPCLEELQELSRDTIANLSIWSKCLLTGFTEHEPTGKWENIQLHLSESSKPKLPRTLSQKDTSLSMVDWNCGRSSPTENDAHHKNPFKDPRRDLPTIVAEQELERRMHSFNNEVLFHHEITLMKRIIHDDEARTIQLIPKHLLDYDDPLTSIPNRVQCSICTFETKLAARPTKLLLHPALWRELVHKDQNVKCASLHDQIQHNIYGHIGDLTVHCSHALPMDHIIISAIEEITGMMLLTPPEASTRRRHTTRHLLEMDWQCFIKMPNPLALKAFVI